MRVFCKNALVVDAAERALGALDGVDSAVVLAAGAEDLWIQRDEYMRENGGTRATHVGIGALADARYLIKALWAGVSDDRRTLRKLAASRT